MTACTDHNHWSGENDWNVDENKTRAAGGGHAHAGLMIYQGDNFPAEYRGAACMCNLHGNCVNFDMLDRSGAEVVARHGGNLLQASDLGFRAIDLKYGPDGSVYVCDWNSGGVSRFGLQRVATDRAIYRIAYGSPQPIQADLGKLPDEELIALHDHPNEWFVRRARLVLQHRAQLGKLDARHARATVGTCRDAAQPATRRLRSLWTWHAVRDAVGVSTEADLRRQLLADRHARDPRLGGSADGRGAPVSRQTLDEFVLLAHDDASPGFSAS